MHILLIFIIYCWNNIIEKFYSLRYIPNVDFYLIELPNNLIYCKLEVITGIRHHDKLQITNKSLISYLKYFLFDIQEDLDIYIYLV